ncbi:MAG TPA: hypothetical protein PLH79_09255 [bacterium]|nr:hypothetical protein [bacterium]HPP00658.1 hypothetical protein [bacterium]HXK92153.1 hypothetical protein [bacterium]
MKEAIIVSNFSCAMISAKWALDLGFSQVRQILFLIGGLLLGPVMLLILYIFCVQKAMKEGGSGGKVL